MIQDGTTSLMVAAIGGHGSVVALLLDAKADVNRANTVRHAILSFIMKMHGSNGHEN
jgi:ankyrin repeat protein